MSGVFGNPWLYNATPPFYNYLINQSLRFNDDDSAYLSRTPASASNRKTWTWSAWVKRGNIGSNQYLFQARIDDSSTEGNKVTFYFLSDNTIRVLNQTTVWKQTSAVFRDTSAWMHIVLTVDTTNATTNNRVRIYINGEEASYSTNAGPSLNADLAVNSTNPHYIGQEHGGYSYFDGYLAEVNFVDGTALTPASFGETKDGVWVAKDSSGLTFGNNGFYLPFDDSSAIGDDESSNTNDFTANNFSAHDVVPDSPTNNFATMSPLLTDTNNTTFSEGNLKTVNSAASTSGSSIAVNSGKWFVEMVCTAKTASNAMIGICTVDGFDGQKQLDESDNGGSGHGYVMNATKLPGGASYGATWAIDDIIGVALDLDSGQNTVTFYKNGSSQGAIDIDNALYVFCNSNGQGSSTVTYVSNFGQDGTFAGEITAGGNSDGNGVGDFKYSVPSGYLALCSQNLPEASIIDGSKHFNTVLWTGTGSGGTRAVSGVGFSPDWVWAKNLTQNYSHTLYDSVRGAGNDKEFQSNDTAAEGDGNNNQYGYLSAFDSDGFTSTSGSEGDANNLYFNESSKNYAAWNWKAGGATPTKTYTVKVVSDSGNKYRFDDFGTSAVTLNLQEGGTYTFDQSDSSNAGHPLRFSTTSDGTHGGGSEYTTGVTTTGTPGNAGAKTVITVAASAATLYYYCTQHSGMGGQANTNATFGSTNFDGSLLSTVSANTDAGFSIVSYSGSNSAGSFGHGLSQAVELVIIKQRNNASFWATGYNVPDWTWSSDYIQLQDDAQKGADGGSTIFTSAPSSTVVNIGGGSVTSTSGKNLIAYCFHSVEGYSKIGQYEGNNLADGTFVYTGFRPAFLLVKSLDTEVQWLLLDNKRDPYNVGANYTSPDIPNAFAAVSGGFYDLLSNGFKWRLGSGNLGSANAANTYVYYAVAEQPFKFANAR